MKQTVKIFAFLTILTLLFQIIPAASAGDTATKDHLKILLIGNSYSEDVSDSRTNDDMTAYLGYSTLYNMIKSVVGDGCDVEIGLIMSGGKSFQWHATMAETEGEQYAFRLVGDSTEGLWVTVKDPATSKYALEYTEWDVVTLQPYGKETYRAPSTSTVKKYVNLSESVPYLLDYVETYNPGADIYLYLVWSMTNDLEYNAGYDTYMDIRKYEPAALGYCGAETGKSFSGIIPIGTAIQTARTTFLALQSYVNPYADNKEAVNFETDPIMGLQRDRLHVSYSVGRYIAGLVFTSVVVPEELVNDDPYDVDIRVAPGAHRLPDIYKEVAIASAESAVSSLGSEGYLMPSDLSAYTTDPADMVMKDLSSGVSVLVQDSEDMIKTAVKNAITAIYPDAFDIAVTLPDDFSTNDSETVANVILSYGYTTVKGSIPVDISDHIHVYSDSVIYRNDCRLPVTTVHKCFVCGRQYSDDTLLTSCPGEDKFTDMPAYGNWAHNGIDYVLYTGLMNGMSDRLFCPSLPMSRAMLVTVLYRQSGSPETSSEVPFTDIRADWYRNAVAWAYENDIVKGTSDTTFNPDANITREQIAVLLYRYSSSNGEDVSPGSDISVFPDYSAVHDWARKELAWANGKGIILGLSTGNGDILDPTGNATRAQVATILMRLLNAQQ